MIGMERNIGSARAQDAEDRGVGVEMFCSEDRYAFAMFRISFAPIAEGQSPIEKRRIAPFPITDPQGDPIGP